MDLANAFDTVNHKILLYKLSRYGMHGLVLDWFTRYLISHYQYVQIDIVCSALMPISCVY